MLEVSAAGQSTTGQVADVADLDVFVDKLAAAGSDRSTRMARAEIRRLIAAGGCPPGLRRLAEALAASVAEPPLPRRPVDDRASIVTAMRENPLVVLEDVATDGVAQAVASLLADGRRVIITAVTRPELAALRKALPAEVTDRALNRLPALPAADMRQLRGLLATSTPERRARRDQQLPPAGALPPVDDVTELCGQVARAAGGSDAGIIPGLLAGLDPERRAAVTSVARFVDRSLAALRPREENVWAWALLSDLIYSRHRAAFDRMLEDTAQAAAALDAARRAPAVTLTSPLPAEAPEVIRRYLDFLEAGGRARSYFRSPTQREVQPILRHIRVGGMAPETVQDLQLVLRHLEFGDRLNRIDAGCGEMGIPAPRYAGELTELSAGLANVAAAARSVGALRHDVLFLHPSSPLAVPDVAAAEEIAAAILEYVEQGSAVEAGRVLDRLAGELTALSAETSTAPEHEQAVAALRDRDAEAYGTAVEALVGARRELQDEARQIALMERLRSAEPQLAEAWSGRLDDDTTGLGLASFVPLERLLEALPASDTADVVLVLGAAKLGVERLLVMAAAPRLIAVVGPGERPDGPPTLLSVLQRAAALVIRAGVEANARVVKLAPGARKAPVAKRAQVG